MNPNVRKVTEGAMVVALYGLFLMLNMQLGGFLQYNFMFITPLFILVYTVRHDLKYACIVAISVILLTFMISMIQTVFFIVFATALGIAYGCLVKAKKSSRTLLILAIIMSIIGNFLVNVVFASFLGIDMSTLISEIELVVSQLDIESLNISMQSLIYLVFVLEIVLLGLLEGVLTHFLAIIILKRLKVEGIDKFAQIKPIGLKKHSKLMGYLSFMFFSCGIMLRYVKINEVATLIITGLYLISMGYLMFYGFIAIVLYGSVRYKKNLGLIVILLVFIFNIVAMYALCTFGFLYLTTDMRERILSRRS